MMLVVIMEGIELYFFLIRLSRLLRGYSILPLLLPSFFFCFHLCCKASVHLENFDKFIEAKKTV